MTLRYISFMVLALVASACSSESSGQGDAASGSGGSTGSSGGDDNPFGDLPGQGGGSSGSGGGDACGTVLPVIYRDFSESHPDFEMDYRGDGVRRRLVKPELDSSLKPQFLSAVGCPADLNTPLGCREGTPNQPVIEGGQTSFDQWYRDVDGVNISFTKELALTESAAGSGQYVFDSADFFPLLPEEGFGITPANHYRNQNFLFTTEVHLRFGYVAGQKFSFRGDDDLWIFVNNRLALDLGSMHGPESGVIDFDAQATELGIVPGGTYSMDIFHAERHTDGSNFRIETNISCFTPIDVPK
jgi:fibro-slime domain-containing protein